MSNRRDLNLTVHGAVEGAALGEDGVLVTSTLSEVHSHPLKIIKIFVNTRLRDKRDNIIQVSPLSAKIIPKPIIYHVD